MPVGLTTGSVPDGSRTITTSGGAAAVTRANVEDLAVSMYRNGGKPNVMMVSAEGKVALSRLFNADNTTGTSRDIRRLESMEKKLNIAITGVMTDFGFDLAIVQNYIMDSFAGGASGANNGASQAVLMYDSSMVKSAVLTPMTTEEDRQARYGRAGIIYDECTLEVKNPNAIGGIYNVSF